MSKFRLKRCLVQTEKEQCAAEYLTDETLLISTLSMKLTTLYKIPIVLEEFIRQICTFLE